MRAGQVVGLVLGLANQRMRAIGIIRECGVDEFMAAVEAQFSGALRQQAGTYLYDGQPASYEDWPAEVRSIAQIIDLEEGPSSSPQ